MAPKACTVCDASGRVLSFALLSGQGHELRAAPGLLAVARALGPIGREVCDRGYSSHAWRQRIRAVAAESVSPSQPIHPPVVYDRSAYARRHRIGNLWARLKEWRAIAPRYEKIAASYLGALHLAAS